MFFDLPFNTNPKFNNMKKSFTLLIALMVYGVLFGQKYKEMMNDPSVNVYDVIKEAEVYFESHAKGRGSGWKDYQRWKYDGEKRYFPSGERMVVQKDPSVKKLLQAPLVRLKSATAVAGNWEELGPVSPRFNVNDGIPGTGRIESVWIDPNDTNYIYAGSRTGGFFKTTDGGHTWDSSSQGLPVIGCNAIDACDSNRNLVYMGSSGGVHYWTPYGLGVLKSSDGGESWQTTSLNFNVDDNFAVKKIQIHPTDSSTVYVGGASGLYKSTDGLATYTQVLSGNCKDFELKPGDPNTLYAAIGTSIYKSSNGGASFTQLSGVSGELLTVSEANSSYLYVSNGTTIYKSTNSGLNFTSSTVASASWGGFCASDTDADVLFNGANFIYVSTNGGANFTKRGNDYNFYPLTTFSGWDHREITCTNGTFYSCNDAHLTCTSDNGLSWDYLIKGEMGVRDNYDMGSSVTSPYNILTGSQDHGTYKFTNGIWHSQMGGDGMMCGFDTDDEEIFFMSYQEGNIQRMDHGIQTYVSPATNGYWETPFVIHPVASNTIFAAYNKVYKSTDNGSSWSSISNIRNLPGNLTMLQVAPSNTAYVYAAYQNRIWYTSGGKKPWTEITAGLPNLWINSIAVHPNDPKTVYVTMDGYSNGSKVYKTTDGGDNWTNISGTLPNIPALSIVIDDNSTNSLYLGMDMGVYYTDDNQTDWIPFNNGIPNVTARTLEIHPTLGKIRLATWGRGLWESDLYGAENNAPIAEFTANILEIAPGDLVGFTDRSTGTPTSWSWTFEGGTPFSSTSENPLVSYAAAGSYDVTLTVSNPNGSDQITKTGIINVIEPDYCGASGYIGSGDDWISNVTFNSLNNNSVQTLYSDFTEFSTIIDKGSTYSLSVTMNNSYAVNRIYAWADWNQNLIFDADELILSGDLDANHNLTGQVTVPSEATIGSTRLRVRCQYNDTDPGEPCGDGYYGEVEDYTLIVQGSAYCVAAGASGTGSDWISNVTFNGLNNNSSQTLYSDFTSFSTIVDRGSTHSLSVSMNNSYLINRIYAWADWNQDGIFSANELILSGDPDTSHNLTGQVTIPSDAIIGNTCLRVRCQYNDTDPGEPCGEGYYGEVEDYALIVQDAGVPQEKTVQGMDRLERNEFIMYPNPAKDWIMIRSKLSGEFSVEVFDMYGRIVVRDEFSTVSEDAIRIPLNNASNGMHFIRFVVGNETIVEKINIFK